MEKVENSLEAWCKSNNFPYSVALNFDAGIETLDDLKTISKKDLEYVCDLLNLNDTKKTEFMKAVLGLSSQTLMTWCNKNGFGRFDDALAAQNFSSPLEFTNLAESELDKVAANAGLIVLFRKKFLNAVKALQDLKKWCDSHYLTKCADMLLEYGFSSLAQLVEINDEDLNKLVVDINKKFGLGQKFSFAVRGLRNKRSEEEKCDNNMSVCPGKSRDSLRKSEHDSKEENVRSANSFCCEKQLLPSQIDQQLRQKGFEDPADLQKLCYDHHSNILCDPMNLNGNMNKKFQKSVGTLASRKQEAMIEKTITAIVLGMTGAGKSSLINLFYAWSKNIQKVEDIKKVLIPTKYLPGIGKHSEFSHTDQSKSQTKKCNIYKFDLVYESTIYHLQFMDTPGLGDVEGIKSDDDHVQNILDTVSTTPELNAIILMINGSDARVSHRLLYVMAKVIGIIPNVCQENLLVLLSNVYMKPNLDVKHLFKMKIPAEHIFYMNNEVFSIDAKNELNPTLMEVNFLYDQLKLKLKNFLDVGSTMRISDTSGFRKLKVQRDEFKNAIRLLQKSCEDLNGKKKYLVVILQI